MLHDARWWLVSYDVRDPKRLRKAAKLVAGTGPRMQFSVYRCWLTPRQMEKLRWELTEFLTPEDDVLFIPLCERCHQGIRITHAETKTIDWPAAPPTHRLA
jgi:CRISPR-associated protein Cas2